MAPRYRKITVAIWGDARFRALSQIPPCAQGLWLYLLTGRETIKVPGLIPAGKHALAESLKWKPEAFAKAWAEIEHQGMALADWDAPLVWVPNAIRHNEPESPNVVVGWRDAWLEVPDCELKHKAWRGLKGYLETMGLAFGKAFSEGAPEPEWVGQRHPLANQEQEQEQEQERETLRLVPEPLVDVRFKPTIDVLFRVFGELRPGSKPTFAKRQGKRLKDFLADHQDATAEAVGSRWRQSLSLGSRYPGTARIELFLDRWDEFTTGPNPAANGAAKKRTMAPIGDWEDPAKASETL